MTQDETMAILADVLAGIAPDADLSTVGADEELREVLDLDSMDFQNLVIGLHERSGLPIPEEDYPKLFTLAGIIAYFAAAKPA